MQRLFATQFPLNPKYELEQIKRFIKNYYNEKKAISGTSLLQTQREEDYAQDNEGEIWGLRSLNIYPFNSRNSQEIIVSKEVSGRLMVSLSSYYQEDLFSPNIKKARNLGILHALIRNWGGGIDREIEVDGKPKYFSQEIVDLSEIKASMPMICLSQSDTKEKHPNLDYTELARIFGGVAHVFVGRKFRGSMLSGKSIRYLECTDGEIIAYHKNVPHGFKFVPNAVSDRLAQSQKNFEIYMMETFNMMFSTRVIREDLTWERLMKRREKVGKRWYNARIEDLERRLEEKK